MVSSTDSSNFAKAISLSFLTASSRLYLRPGSIFSIAARYFFPCFFISELRGANERYALPLSKSSNEGDFSFFILPPLSFHSQSHLPRRSLDCSHRAFEISGIEVGHFCFRDLFDLGARYLADLLFLRTAGTFFDRRRLLQKVRRRRRFRFKGKRAIRI